MKFSDLWDRWQPRSDRNRLHWKFKGRKHIPNINYLLNQIHKMLKIEYHNKRFPIPTTQNSVKKLREFYLAMLKDLKDNGQLDSIPKEYISSIASQLTLDNKPVDFISNLPILSSEISITSPVTPIITNGTTKPITDFFKPIQNREK
jgi:hypothetical protein